jgi:prepilin-type N-terminal cleavage/methylation domain-containing protein
VETLVSARRRRGFTLIEAAIAVVIVGLASVAVLGAFGTELRTADRARRALDSRALAEQRLTSLQLTPVLLLDRLPDSLARGRFDRPFDAYSWKAAAKLSRDVEFVYDLSVQVAWDGGNFALDSRVYRPPPPVVGR